MSDLADNLLSSLDERRAPESEDTPPALDTRQHPAVQYQPHGEEPNGGSRGPGAAGRDVHDDVGLRLADRWPSSGRRHRRSRAAARAGRRLLGLLGLLERVSPECETALAQ